MADRRLILVTNDDGIHAAGIEALARAGGALGEVWVVAPSREQSGVSHGLTLREPLRVAETERNGLPFGLAVTGTPVDCVKLALKRLLPRRPDLVLSGINHGPNIGINNLYSGTVGAALEAAAHGIPAVAVSLGAFLDLDFEVAEGVARRIAIRVLERGLPARSILSVNVPHRPVSEIRGIRVARQSPGGIREDYERRVDPVGRETYWITGAFETNGKDETYDDVAFRAGWITVTPMWGDLTLHDGLEGVDRMLEGI